MDVAFCIREIPLLSIESFVFRVHFCGLVEPLHFVGSCVFLVFFFTSFCFIGTMVRWFDRVRVLSSMTMTSIVNTFSNKINLGCFFIVLLILLPFVVYITKGIK